MRAPAQLKVRRASISTHLILLGMLLGARSGIAQSVPVVRDFEDLTVGTTVYSQYPGVIFVGGDSTNPDGSHHVAIAGPPIPYGTASPVNVLSLRFLAGEFGSSSAILSFALAQSSVRLATGLASSLSGNYTILLRGYETDPTVPLEGGFYPNPVAQVAAPCLGSGPTRIDNSLEITDPGTHIWYAYLALATCAQPFQPALLAGKTLMIDNLAYQRPLALQPPDTIPPVVQVTYPPNFSGTVLSPLTGLFINVDVTANVIDAGGIASASASINGGPPVPMEYACAPNRAPTDPCTTHVYLDDKVGMKEGSNEVELTAQDFAGNSGGTSLHFQFVKTPPPPPATNDIFPTAYEVTQAVDPGPIHLRDVDYNPSTESYHVIPSFPPLTAGKATLVRIYGAGTAAVDDVIASASVDRRGCSANCLLGILPLLAAPPNILNHSGISLVAIGQPGSSPSDNVGSMVNTWNFLIPAAWTTGPLTVHVKVNSNHVPECCVDNNYVDIDLNFLTLPTLSLHLPLISINGTLGRSEFSDYKPDPQSINPIAQYLNQVYPQVINAHARPAFAPAEISVDPDIPLAIPSARPGLLDIVARIGDNPAWDRTDFLLGLYKGRPNGGFPFERYGDLNITGFAYTSRRAAIANAAFPAAAAQEIGHTIGLPHATHDHGEGPSGCIYGTTWCDFPVTHAKLGAWGTEIDDINNAFNLYAPDDTAPGVHIHDFMSYGPTARWVSLFTYLLLRDHYGIDGWSQNDRIHYKLQTQPVPVGALLVRGSLDPPTLTPVYYTLTTGLLADHILEPAPAGVPYPDIYTLEGRDDHGNTLFIRNFFPHEATHIEQRWFDELVPYGPTTLSTLRLLKGQQVLAERTSDLHTQPSLTIDRPQPGDVWPAGTVQTIRWTVSNPSGRPVFFRVSYTPDGGNTYRALATDVQGDSLVVNVDDLMASQDPGASGVQVLVSDAASFGDSGDETSGLTVAAKPPTVHIVQPSDASFAAADFPLTLKGSAASPDEEAFGAQLVWTSDRDGMLGTGGTLAATLTAGEHTITLTGTDSLGLAGQASVQIHVLPATSRHLALVPTDGITLGCQRYLTRSVTKLIKRLVACGRQGAAAVLHGRSPAIDKCHESAKAKYQRAVNRRLRHCPACARAKSAGLANPVEAFVTRTASLIYCDGPAPSGNGHCQDGALQNLSELARGIIKCHRTAAQGALTTGVFDDQACHTREVALYRHRNSILKQCPACFVANSDRSVISKETETFLDTTVNQAIFCAGSVPAG